MKLLAQIEELDKKRFKKVADPMQGANSRVERFKSKSGPEETRFVKKINLEDQLADLVSELQSRMVIEHVNKAFRAYGYKTNLLNIPIETEWHIEVDRGDADIHIVSSGFNRGKPSAVHKHGEEMSNLITAKAAFLYALVGNRDFNGGNIILNNKSKHKNYAIDFAAAFTQPLHNFNLSDTYDNESKIGRWANYLNFWDSYIEHNKDYVLESMKDVEKQIINKLKIELKKIGYEEEFSEYSERVSDISRENINNLEENFVSLSTRIDDELIQVKRYARKKK